MDSFQLGLVNSLEQAILFECWLQFIDQAVVLSVLCQQHNWARAVKQPQNIGRLWHTSADLYNARKPCCYPDKWQVYCLSLLPF